MFELSQDAVLVLTDVESMMRWCGIAMMCLIAFSEAGLFSGFFSQVVSQNRSALRIIDH